MLRYQNITQGVPKNRETAVVVDIKPTQKVQLIRVKELITEDLNCLENIMNYCPKRVLNEEKIKSVDKVLSISDGDTSTYKKRSS